MEALVHIVARSTQFSGADTIDKRGGQVVVVMSEKADMKETSLWDLGDFNGAIEKTKRRTRRTLEKGGGGGGG